MTRKDIVDRISEQYALPKTMADGIVCSIVDIVCGSLEKGEDVILRGFGRFTVRTARQKTGHDFKTGQVHIIGERRVPVFRFARKRMMDLNR